jgi:hypothetical protein
VIWFSDILLIATSSNLKKCLEITVRNQLHKPLSTVGSLSWFYGSISQNRLKTEAEAMALLRGLTDSQLTVALAQIKALEEL